MKSECTICVEMGNLCHTELSVRHETEEGTYLYDWDTYLFLCERGDVPDIQHASVEGEVSNR